MLGREQVIARLELLVVRRGSDAKSSGGSSELKQCFDTSQFSNLGRARGAVADPGGKVKRTA
eukprot:7781996-Pyramimonas_sp.AAC.1